MHRKESFGKFQEQDQCSGSDPGVCESLNAPGFDHRSDGRCQYGKNILESGRQKEYFLKDILQR